MVCIGIGSNGRKKGRTNNEERMERQRESKKERDRPLSSPLYSSLPWLSFLLYPFLMDNVNAFSFEVAPNRG
jgi:hypothetical protein